MSAVHRRPFYTEYAWAFDLLIDRPVRKECAAIAAWLVERGVLPGAKILDAGCGTGRYAIELARRGYRVHGLDLSPELIEIATDATAKSRNPPSFAVGDITALSGVRYAGILCRGVLNDIIEDVARDWAVGGFAAALQPAGTLILDVREWTASAERKTREPLFRKRVCTDRGALTFTSITEVDRDHRQLVLSERHELVDEDGEHTSEYLFLMRCWTRDELNVVLSTHGFRNIQYFGAYDRGVEAGATDRLVAVAQR